MSKTDFQEYICRPFCDFFKPGVKEEMTCRGAVLVEQLVRRRRLTPRDFQEPGSGRKPFSRAGRLIWRPPFAGTALSGPRIVISNPPIPRPIAGPAEAWSSCAGSRKMG